MPSTTEPFSPTVMDTYDSSTSEIRHVEFVDGPRAGLFAKSVYDEDAAMPKFVAIGDHDSLHAVFDSKLRFYVLAEDGRYHYLELE